MTELEMMLKSDDREIALLGATILARYHQDKLEEERFKNLKWHFIFEKHEEDYKIYRCQRVDSVGKIVVIEAYPTDRWKADMNLADIYRKSILNKKL